MATTNGTEYRVRVSTDGGTTKTPILTETEANLSVTAETRSTTSKDTCEWQGNAPGSKGWELGGSAYHEKAPTNLAELVDMVNTEVDVYLTPIDCTDGSEITGEIEYHGKAICTQADASFPDKETGTVTYSFIGNGPLNKTTLS